MKNVKNEKYALLFFTLNPISNQHDPNNQIVNHDARDYES
jgi:hypothetical protein